MEQENPMEYRYLGNTGLQVSLLSFGHIIAYDTPEFEQQFFQMIQTCLDSGVNYFDTAEVYTDGLMETTLGKTLRKSNVKRDEYVISTKFFLKSFSEYTLNKVGLSNKRIQEAVKGSLDRLQLDNVDIVYCHRSDPNTPIEETCRVMNWLIENNKTYYWGTSEWTAQQISEAFAVCDRLGLIKPIWSPLCQGLLTGKYIHGIPLDSRLHLWDFYSIFMKPFLTETEKPKTVQKLQDLQVIADSLQCSLAQLGLAWVIKNPDVSTVLMGASKSWQIKENIKSLHVYRHLLNSDIEQKIENILQNKPDTYLDYKQWKKFNPIR